MASVAAKQLPGSQQLVLSEHGDTAVSVHSGQELPALTELDGSDNNNGKLDRVVDRVKPWFMVHGLAHCLCIDRHPMDRHPKDRHPKDRHPIDSTL